MTNPGLRQATPNDLNQLFRLHRLTMHNHVEAIWGWDEAQQEQRFRDRFDPSKYKIITYEGQDIGVLCIVEEEDRVSLHLIEILPEFQKRGLGTSVLGTVLTDAQRKGKPTVLQVFKINPALRLYQRLGFVITGETETHYLMRAEPERHQEHNLLEGSLGED
jgi:ribosomal protein S18 acetylase RimI-like enzyme